jgi:hypothetical protein
MTRRIDKTQVKKIHTLVSVLRMPDDLYRTLLQNTFSVTSSKELSSGQAGRLILLLQDFAQTFQRGEKPYCEAHFQHLGYRPDMATPSQLQKIEALWDRLYPENSAASLRTFLSRQFKVSDLRFLDSASARKVFYVLKTIQRRKATTLKIGSQDAQGCGGAAIIRAAGPKRKLNTV